MAQDQVKLGPCPLCGGDAKMNHYGEITCSSCDMPYVDVKIWTKLSALAEQNRRRGDVLERCRRYFDDSMTVDEIVLSDEDWSNEAMAKMCEEALK